METSGPGTVFSDKAHKLPQASTVGAPFPASCYMLNLTLNQSPTYSADAFSTAGAHLTAQKNACMDLLPPLKMLQGEQAGRQASLLHPEFDPGAKQLVVAEKVCPRAFAASQSMWAEHLVCVP